MDEISFTATDSAGEKIVIDQNYINNNLANLIKDTALSKFDPYRVQTIETPEFDPTAEPSQVA